MFEKQKKYFENLFKNDSLGHAYLFSGEDTAGKRALAENICAVLTGKGFSGNPDLKLIKPDTEKGDTKIYIEDIRELKSFMYLKPHSSEHKLAVIEDANVMTAEAANAILKILEEPPQNSVLILVSSRPKLLPRTILSRCETVVFPPAPETKTAETDKALAELRKILKQSLAERIKYAKNLYEKEDYAALVNLWLRSLRLQFILSLSKGEYKPAAVTILQNLAHLSHTISQPQYNHRIA